MKDLKTILLMTGAGLLVEFAIRKSPLKTFFI